MTFKTVFDAAQQGFVGWQGVLVGLCLVSVFGVVAFRPNWLEGLPLAGPKGRTRVIFGRIGFGFALFLTIGISAADVDNWWVIPYGLRHGRYDVVEGPVTNFVPGGNHKVESFWVQGLRFVYDSSDIPGFNETAAKGGPIHEGLYVRITYSDLQILRLEVVQ